ncbi:MAG: hypothetical protein WDZ74_02530 [Candidatus Paceibacterota bacterium]
MDEQNQNEMNENHTEEETPMGGDESVNVNVENDHEGKSGMLGTVAIIVLVALLGYGIYAYFNRDNGTAVDEEGQVEDIELELDGGVGAEGEIPSADVPAE